MGRRENRGNLKEGVKEAGGAGGFLSGAYRGIWVFK
jgi:hypothetical protein